MFCFQLFHSSVKPYHANQLLIPSKSTTILLNSSWQTCHGLLMNYEMMLLLALTINQISYTRTEWTYSYSCLFGLVLSDPVWSAAEQTSQVSHTLHIQTSIATLTLDSLIKGNLESLGITLNEPSVHEVFKK